MVDSLRDRGIIRRCEGLCKTCKHYYPKKRHNFCNTAGLLGIICEEQNITISVLVCGKHVNNHEH